MPRDHAEQGRLAGAVRADDADDAPGRQREVEVLDQQAIAVALAQILGLDHHVAEPFSGRDVDLDAVDLDPRLGRHQLLVAVQARTRVLLLRLRGRARPFELAPERTLARTLLLLLLREALLLLLEPARVVALVRIAARAVELENPAGDVVQEVAVMGHRDDGAGVVLEKPLEPRHRLRVEVVGGLVEQQHVGAREQQTAQRHAPPLAAGQLRHGRIGGREPQRIHRRVECALDVPAVRRVDPFLHRAHLVEQALHLVGSERLGHAPGQLVEAVEQRARVAQAVLDVAAHIPPLVEPRLLLEHSDGRPRREPYLASVLGLDAGEDAQERALARSVRADDADLGAVEEGERQNP